MWSGHHYFKTAISYYRCKHILAAAYTVPGGLNSIIQTEVIQAVLLILGYIVLIYFAFDKVGGWSGIIDGLNAMGA